MSIITYHIFNSIIKTGDALYQDLSWKLSEISGKAYLFLDEIQEVIQWETCVNSLSVDFDANIYITGSNALKGTARDHSISLWGNKLARFMAPGPKRSLISSMSRSMLL
ncbi:AAA family ATPase [Syntrophomonas wolfei]|uniref:AAA family ATPase n=1 Tax=Syntrophomonas wolfei TaxID=863 RepID=UPI001F2238C5|nr:AAA family ATPase [Syntrophomonas wolfei]